MPDSQESLYPGFESFESYGSDFQKQQNLDFFSFTSPPDILAPHPDLFELELDHSLAGFNETELHQLLAVENDAFLYLRSDTPTCGPPSSITVSSASSAYDSRYSESFYNSSSYNSSSNYSFPLDMDMDFQKFTVEAAMSDYGSSHGVDHASGYSAMSPSDPLTLPNPVEAFESTHPRTSSFSDYGPSRSSAPSTEFYKFDGAAQAQAQSATITPAHVSPQMPARTARHSRSLSSSSPQAMTVDDNSKSDTRKRYRCEVCPRAFARAYNLKTHMATHDPNRLKPHVCPHRGCNRSFSRKHDLGRHLVSIHRDGSECSSSSSSEHSPSSKRAIGVDQGPRSWCNSCGRGWIGDTGSTCNCDDVK